MSKLPAVKPKILIKKFEKIGYVKDRQKGSHIILFHPSLKRRVVIPLHIKDLPKGTLLSIIKQAGLTREEFLKL
ncbi:MAG: type II toxin-antitoxin system HicA family toxin [bacterium]|nr:type II toxin-antitoxin system HicA family toxin [bacterium]